MLNKQFPTTLIVGCERNKDVCNYGGLYTDITEMHPDDDPVFGEYQLVRTGRFVKPKVENIIKYDKE